MKYISIHHSASMRDNCAYYKKGKIYTYEEYSKLIRRRQLIKDVIKDIVFIVVLGVIMVFRGYVFLEYGI